MTTKMKQRVNLLVMLLIGCAIGFAAGRFVCGGKFPGRFAPDGKGPLDFLSRKLSLTDDQREKVKVIFAAHRPEIEASHKEAFDRFETIRKGIHSEISEVLTAEQKQRFEELHKKMEERRKEHRGFGPPHWGPPPPPPEP